MWAGQAYRGQTLASGVGPREQGLSLAWNFARSIRLARELPGSMCFCVSLCIAGITGVYLHLAFYVDSKNQNSDPHPCQASFMG